MTRREKPATRSRRARLAQAAKGNANALRHGVFAVVANAPDVADEVALTYALHPELDPLRDRRLVESYALSSVQWRKAIAAMDTAGLTRELTAYESKLNAIVERRERELRATVAARRKAAAPTEGLDAARYRS